MLSAGRGSRSVPTEEPTSTAGPKPPRRQQQAGQLWWHQFTRTESTLLMKTPLPEPLSLPWKLKPVSWAQSGSERLADGRRRFWIKEELTGITPDMLAWWFGHLEGDIEIAGRLLPRYRVWHPFDHVSVCYVRRAPDGSIGPGAKIAAREFLGRNPRYKVDGVATIEKLDREGFINTCVGYLVHPFINKVVKLRFLLF